MQFFIGVDPGATGGISKLTRDGKLEVVGFGGKEPHQIAHIFDTFLEDDSFIVIEKVHSMPGQSISAMFNFGQSTGLLHGFINMKLLVLKNCVFHQVDPAVWKRSIGLKSRMTYTERKNLAKDMAKELFPTVKFTHQTAEAALLAHYGKSVLFADYDNL